MILDGFSINKPSSYWWSPIDGSLVGLPHCCCGRKRLQRSLSLNGSLLESPRWSGPALVGKSRRSHAIWIIYILYILYIILYILYYIFYIIYIISYVLYYIYYIYIYIILYIYTILYYIILHYITWRYIIYDSISTIILFLSYVILV